MKKMNTENKRIITVLFVLCLLFISIIIYLSYFEVFMASSIKKNSYNKRQWLDEEEILRGRIYDRNQNLLAYSTKEKGGQQRHYKYGSLYSHIIGYSTRTHGKEGLEKTYNSPLLNLSDYNSINELKKAFTFLHKEQKGNNLVVTIDHRLQEYTKGLLGQQKGSIVVMNPKNGEIYSMVSYPDFNPNTLNETWESIVENEDSPLVNRATTGLYTPGSIFKIIPASSALEQENINTNFNCTGQVNIDGYILKDYKGTAHGKIDLKESLVKSCNVAFSQIGLELGQKNLEEIAERFMLNHKIPFDLDTKSSIFPRSKMSQADLGASSIGQGKILVTPLNMAMMVSTIANNGDMIKPILVKEILNSEDHTLEKYEPEVLSQAIPPEIANNIKDMMVEVVNRGTGKNAKLSSIQVAGKTGTAENNKEKAHSWFVGFAPADNPQVAIAIVLENSGSTGGSLAAPMAKKIIQRALE